MSGCLHVLVRAGKLQRFMSRWKKVCVRTSSTCLGKASREDVFLPLTQMCKQLTHWPPLSQDSDHGLMSICFGYQTSELERIPKALFPRESDSPAAGRRQRGVWFIK